MNLNSLFRDAETDSPQENEWGIVAPARQAGSVVTPISDQRVAPASASAAPAPAVRQCRYCTETLPPDARHCPLCLRDVSEADAEPRHGGAPLGDGRRHAPAAVTIEAPGSVSGSGGEAVYTLESPALCPECQAEIASIHVIRVVRTQVSFTSTLPRKAYVVACPECRRLLSAGLSGLL